MKNFEDFLIDKHAEQYIGTDDNMPDDFNNWIGYLDVDEWLEFGDKFVSYLQQDIKKNYIALGKKNYLGNLPPKSSHPLDGE